MKLYKRRGQDRWSGYRNEGRKGISGSAELMPDGRYQVRYSLSNGYGEGIKGTFVSSKLKDAENMLDSILDNSLNVIQYKQIAPEDDIKDCYDRDGDIFCPNCMGYYWIGVGGNIRECTTCGCCFNADDATVFYDQWNHSVFDKYRDETENSRKRIFSKRDWTIAEGGFRYTPENFDSGYYNKLMNYGNPKDRSRILSFNLRGRLFGRRR
jgi:hypothetical protein